MDIQLDKNCRKVLRFIKNHGESGVSWELLHQKFGEYADPFFLESLSRELYIMTKNKDGFWVDFNLSGHIYYGDFISVSTPKGNQFIESHDFDLFKWLIPTIISILALVISILSLIA